MTPIVKLRWARRERAKKFGRYLYLRAATRIRSLVSCGIEPATGERLMTSDTVAGESPNRSASSFRLTGLVPIRTVRAARFPVFSVTTLSPRSAVSHKSNRARKEILYENALNTY